jgi:tetratricopeptide (TPR) repeat protein
MEKPLRPCAYCAKNHAPQRCPCLMVSYCGPECQKTHWGEHKKTCSVHEKNNMDATKKEHGNDSLEAITAQFNLGHTFLNNGHHEKAQKISLKCLKKCYAQHFETSSKEKQKLVMFILTSLGDYYVIRGESDKASEMFTAARVLCQKMYGNDNPLLTCISHWIDVADRTILPQNDSTDIDYYKKALKSCQDDDEIISTNYKLCGSYYNAGKLDLAMEAGLKTLDHARKKCRMRKVGDALLILSQVLCHKGEFDQAWSNLEETLPILRAECGEKSASVAEALSLIGDIYVYQGKNDDALKFYKKALRYTRRSAGDKYRKLRDYTRDIVMVYVSQGKYTEALQMLEKDEEFFRSILINYDVLTAKLRMKRDSQSSVQ